MVRGLGHCRDALAQARRRKDLPDPGDDTQSGLVRSLRFLDVLGYGLGVTIGGGIFVQTGAAAVQAGPAVILSFLLAALSCSGTGLCYAELSGIIPSAGSSYSFSYVAVGELAAYLVGFTNVTGNMLSSAAVARGWSGYLEQLLLQLHAPVPAWASDFHWNDKIVSPKAMILLMVLGLLNLLGAKEAASVNAAITVSSVAMLLVFVCVGAFAIDIDNWNPFMPNGLEGVTRAAGMVFFAYLGFDMLACLGAETKHVSTVPKGIVWTLVLSTSIYVATSLVFTGMAEHLAICRFAKSAPLAQAAREKDLQRIALMVYFGALGNMATTVMAGLVAAPRMLLAMAQDGLLPECLGRTSAKGIPTAALLCTVIPSVVLAGFIDFEEAMSPTGTSRPLPDLFGAVYMDDADDDENSPREEAKRAKGTVDVDAHDVVVEERTDGKQLSIPPKVKYNLPLRLVLFALASVGIGPSIAFAFDHPRHDSVSFLTVVAMTLPLAMTLVLITVSISMIVAFAPYRALVAEQRREASEDATKSSFRTPFLPVLPLFGIFMNMLLFSQMPLLAIGRLLGISLLWSLGYFLYSARHSHLGRGVRSETLATARLAEHIE